MYGGGDVGYYCDACWESQVTRRNRAKAVLVAVALLLLILNAVGLVFVRTGGFAVPPRAWIAGSIVVLAVLLALVVGLVVWIRRR